MISAACSELLQRASAYHPLYGDGLSDHMPMALIALDRMGASPARLAEFFTRYSSKLTLRVVPAETIAPISPDAVLGQREHFEAMLAYFRSNLAMHGKDAVLRQWLPLLIPGLGAAAFHAMIRLAYGIDAYDESEIAFGLACWTMDYQSLGDIGAPTSQPLDEIAQSLAQGMAGHRFKPGIIVDRMNEVAALPLVMQTPTQPTELQFQQIADFALRTYAAREDFIVLHMVTGCHAFRVISTHIDGVMVDGLLDDVAGATRHLWHAMLCAYLSTGAQPVKLTAMPAAKYAWPQCLERAVASDNDHVIKLVYTAWREFAVTPDPLYLYVANRIAFGAE